jgi:hypothetical protein
MAARTRSNSFAVKAVLTCAIQFAGRTTGQGDSTALLAATQNMDWLPLVIRLRCRRHIRL